MTYRRFKMEDTSATLAATATLDAPEPQTVAEVASVADPKLENQASEAPTVARLAIVAGGGDDFRFSALQLPPDKIMVAVERAVVRLRNAGCPADQVRSRAVGLVRAGIRNDRRMFTAQTDPTRCFFCGDPEDSERQFIAIVSQKPGYHYFIHHRCHADHSRSVTDRVDQIMAAAGFGDERQRGAA